VSLELRKEEENEWKILQANITNQIKLNGLNGLWNDINVPEFLDKWKLHCFLI